MAQEPLQWPRTGEKGDKAMDTQDSPSSGHSEALTSIQGTVDPDPDLSGVIPPSTPLTWQDWLYLEGMFGPCWWDTTVEVLP